MSDKSQTKEVSIDFELLCKVVGQLFLDSRMRIERLNQQVQQLTEERDQALSLLPGKLADESTAS